MRNRHRSRTGSSLLEFTLIGIPVIFVVFSTVELGRAMWTYHSLTYAINEGARYVVVHGKGCTTAGNNCTTTVSAVASQIATAGIALSRDSLNVSLVSASGTVSCNPLSNCMSDSTQWPPSAANTAGSDITVTGQYAFQSALSVFWPGAGKVAFAPINLPASTRQSIQF